jgi:hypothetical protein
MDTDRDAPYDPEDDDVTVVGDHELVVELRRMAADRARANAGARVPVSSTVPATTAPGTPLPPPVVVPAAVVTPPEPALVAEPRATRRVAAGRRPAPPAPADGDPFGAEDWWDEDGDGDDRSRLVWIVLAVVVGVLAIVALLVLL